MGKKLIETERKSCEVDKGTEKKIERERAKSESQKMEG